MQMESSSEIEQSIWDEAKEKLLISDPRFEGGVMCRQSGEYEASIEFFAELLKTFESSSTPLHLAPLYFNYGSSMVCNIENLIEDEDEEKDLAENDQKETPILESSISSRKRSNQEANLNSDEHELSKHEGISAEAAEEEEDDDEEEEDDDDEEEGNDEDEVAWQCLDMARELYQKALAHPMITNELEKRLKQELARTITRIGDLNMFQNKFADALIEYELSIKLRSENKDPSVENICRLSDSNMQVAFAYLEHLTCHGEGNDVVAEASDGSQIIVAQGKECAQQAIAFRDQAKQLLESLISRLAQEKIDCSKEDKDLICVQYQLLSDFNERMPQRGSSSSSSKKTTDLFVKLSTNTTSQSRTIEINPCMNTCADRVTSMVLTTTQIDMHTRKMEKGKNNAHVVREENTLN
eukprot:CAMPEP_0114343012 /NCGR_PEP_ID=MMETSP0101-20121206/10263_1 /TAXON_ID=38822 ORGANISM="Pteridomonas danica, Strain PT" /NCGR_SAMPLE_ID=MMETSP0101 /ASSEMBLY_ACC=CAM_ASM_000211 /LENGTH=410 /DNA_ID=CAMNT_0001477473 /DNA_START=184 /DNA_END=1413 /DNA_ORIENTATION=+